MSTYLAMIRKEYVRDAQVYKGPQPENADELYDSDKWSDAEGDLVVGTLEASLEQGGEKYVKEHFSKLYKEHTLKIVELADTKCGSFLKALEGDHD